MNDTLLLVFCTSVVSSLLTLLGVYLFVGFSSQLEKEIAANQKYQKPIKGFAGYVLKDIGYVLPSMRNALDMNRGIIKQLDEYRELLESIDKETGYFSSKKFIWSNGHAKMLDDFLSCLYEINCQIKPEEYGHPVYGRHPRNTPDFIREGYGDANDKTESKL